MPVRKLTTTEKQALTDFIDATPPARLSKQLRNMLLLYLRYDLQDGTIPVVADDLLFDMYNLFSFLDALE